MANIRQFRKKTHTAINNFFRRVPIFPRLFCVMLLLTVVPTTLVTLISFHSYVAEIKENTERVQVIMGLMAKGYLEPALFNTQKNELHKEAALLKEQKEAIKRRNAANLSNFVDQGCTVVLP